jgi:hypothetical protein
VDDIVDGTIVQHHTMCVRLADVLSDKRSTEMCFR